MATTVHYVECAHCKRKNPQIKSLKVCRNCGAPLPWAKVPESKTKTTRAAAPSVSIDWGFWSVAAFSFFAPPIGYFLYRAYAESGDEKASAAGLGALLGVLAYIGRFALKLAS